MNIAIAGLGLIGGSFAKAIKAKTGHTVLGLDCSGETLKAAFKYGAIDSADPKGIEYADILLAALYPKSSIEFIQANLEKLKAGAIILDLCGVKRFICTKIKALIGNRDLTFIGGHPMAGRELSGFEHSIPTLFDGASMILTPSPDTPPKKLDIAASLCLEIGFGNITISTPEHHDEMIAFTSQLAHIVSSAYIQNPVCDKYMGFSAGSFADMTRVAKLNEDMWTELFLLNSDYLTAHIDILIRNLTGFRSLIESGDMEGLRAALKTGRECKERLTP